MKEYKNEEMQKTRTDICGCNREEAEGRGHETQAGHEEKTRQDVVVSGVVVYGMPARGHAFKSGVWFRPEDIATGFNLFLPGHDLRYDGEFSRSELGLSPMYQFTPHAGPAQGATFIVAEPTPRAIREKMSMMIAARTKKRPSVIKKTLAAIGIVASLFLCATASSAAGPEQEFGVVVEASRNPRCFQYVVKTARGHSVFLWTGGFVPLKNDLIYGQLSWIGAVPITRYNRPTGMRKPITYGFILGTRVGLAEALNIYHEHEQCK